MLTFPVKPGDECLLVFNERCIDGWWQSGGSSEPLDYRQHDLSDAVAIMGISSLPQVVRPSPPTRWNCAGWTAPPTCAWTKAAP